MRLLTESKATSNCLKDLIIKSKSIYMAVAWASAHFDAFETLKNNSGKIKRLIAGIHFFQTHPDFIKHYQNNENVRFVMLPDGTFHPKIYYFEMPDNSWSCMIGSANFTGAAFSKNQEATVLIESNDSDDGFNDSVLNSIDSWWNMGKNISLEDLDDYQDRWNRMRTVTKRLSGTYGKDTPYGIKPDGGTIPSNIPVCRMTWDDFVKIVKNEHHGITGHTVAGRVNVIETIRSYFFENDQFCKMTINQRKEISGYLWTDELDFRWFGSMRGAGRFKHEVNVNNRYISEALDHIRIQGEITRDDYLRFCDTFGKAFSSGGAGIATASRLLSMKRPDLFVCLASANRIKLCNAFGIRQNVGLVSYWDSIIERIRESRWWNAPRPNEKFDAAIWDARAAFLDSLYYDPKDEPLNEI